MIEQFSRLLLFPYSCGFQSCFKPADWLVFLLVMTKVIDRLSRGFLLISPCCMTGHVGSWGGAVIIVVGTVDEDLCLSNISPKISIRLLTPIIYPSSWLPTTHSDEWSMASSGGRMSVLAKSMSHTFALFWSWTNSKELPITCKRTNLRHIQYVCKISISIFDLKQHCMYRNWVWQNIQEPYVLPQQNLHIWKF